jgi:hypothetical protein
MNLKTAIFAILFGIASAASAQSLAINGVDRDGWGGVYDIDGQNYWWMCIEPNGSGSAGVGQGFIANQMGFEAGWDQQNTQRQTFYQNNPGYYTTAIPKQVAVMEYVLDTYLPWNTLAGASGRFIEQSSNSANYGSDDAFYNAFFAVQNFLSETYGSTVREDFTDMSGYSFFAGNATGNLAAIAARSALFQAILDDIELKDTANFFDTYTAQGTYLIANSLFSELNNSDPNAPDYNWQDALLIVAAPVPEPSGALLIACCGVVVMLRRFRRRA